MSGESDVTITTSANTLTLKKSNADTVLLRLSDPSANKIIAIGVDASGNPHAEGGISIGYNSYIDANNNVAIGTNSKCKAGNSVAIGNNAQSDQQSVAIGHDSDAGFGGTSVGSGTSIGSGAKSGSLSASYGVNTQATGEKCVAISGDALANNTVAVGYDAYCNGVNSMALGYNAGTGDYTNSISIGANSSVGANNVISLGDGTQKVGIGTTSPENFLDLSGDLIVRGSIDIEKPIDSGAYGAGTHIMNFKTYYLSGGGTVYDKGTIKSAIISGVSDKTVLRTDNGYLAFATADTATLYERMRIEKNGKVGIGDTNPDAHLHVRGNGPQLMLEGQTNEDSMVRFSSGPSYENRFHEIRCQFYAISGHWHNNKMLFKVNNGGQDNPSDLMCLDGLGHLGLGTTSPKDYAKFAVRGHRWTNRGGDTWGGTFHGGYGYPGGGTSNQNYSGYFQYAVYCNQLHTASDERIKKNIIDINDDAALQKLRLLKPKSYNYINEYQRGKETVFGFIAQEVGEVFPESVNIIKEHIPNIYEVGEVLQDNSGALTIIQFSNFNTNNILRDASNNIYSNLEIVGEDDKSCEIEIINIIDDSKIQINTDLSNNCLITDDNKKLVFVNGQRVDDFNNLNKSAIWTVTTAALQEVDRQLQAEKTKVSTLESQVADLLIRVASLENV